MYIAVKTIPEGSPLSNICMKFTGGSQKKKEPPSKMAYLVYNDYI